MARAEDVDPAISKTDCWHNHESDLPNWARSPCYSSHPQPQLKVCFLYCKTHSVVNSALH